MTTRSCSASRHDEVNNDHRCLGAMIARRVMPVLAGGLLLSSTAHGALLIVGDSSDPGVPGDKNCTLREAITSVNTGVANPDCPNTAGNPLGTDDAIHLDPSLNGQAILLDGSALVITSNVEVVGPDPGNPTAGVIDAGKLSRVVEVTGSDIDVTLDSLTLRNGKSSDSGGAVLMDSLPVASELTLIDCIITESRADDNGGALHTSFGDTVTVDGCSLYNNVADGKGGAISSISSIAATVTVLGSMIESNDSMLGAIYALGNILVSISDSTIERNSNSASSGRVIPPFLALPKSGAKRPSVSASG